MEEEDEMLLLLLLLLMMMMMMMMMTTTTTTTTVTMIAIVVIMMMMMMIVVVVVVVMMMMMIVVVVVVMMMMMIMMMMIVVVVVVVMMMMMMILLVTTNTEGQWNCSVPYWPDFKDHFVCNLVANCIHGEDEQHCPYTSASCPLTHFRAAGRCFRYVDPDSTLTWNEAGRLCGQGQGRSAYSSYLASFNTPEEWHEVTRLLRLRSLRLKTERVFVGLRYVGDALPMM